MLNRVAWKRVSMSLHARSCLDFRTLCCLFVAKSFHTRGFVSSIACIRTYPSVHAPAAKPWIMERRWGLWMNCDAAAGLLSPYFIEIDRTSHCSMRSIMTSIPEPFIVNLSPTPSTDYLAAMTAPSWPCFASLGLGALLWCTEEAPDGVCRGSRIVMCYHAL